MPIAKISCIPGVTFEGLQPQVIEELKKFQAKIGADIVVTSAKRPGDPAEHGRGLAVDIIVPAFADRLLELYLASERFKFGGIGVYPKWHYAGVVTGGLHLDMRDVSEGARWMGVKVDGVNQYLALDQNNLREFGVI